MTTVDLKTIIYRGGVVRFRIPADWQEEYEPAGGGMFFPPGDQSRTLRLNITTASIAPGTELYPVNVQQFLKHFADERGVAVKTLRLGVAMICYDLPSLDRGQQIVIRCWQIAHAISRSELRIALFTYTLLAEVFMDRNSQEEMKLLERELSSAEFAPILGATSTAPRNSKPWWRFW